MKRNIYVTVSIDQGPAGMPRYIHVPAACACYSGIHWFAGCYYTYLTHAELIQIPGAFYAR
jgi:hypothetical protein